MYNKNHKIQNIHDKKQKRGRLFMATSLNMDYVRDYFTINFFPFTITTPL